MAEVSGSTVDASMYSTLRDQSHVDTRTDVAVNAVEVRGAEARSRAEGQQVDNVVDPDRCVVLLLEEGPHFAAIPTGHGGRHYGLSGCKLHRSWEPNYNSPYRQVP